MSGLMDKVRDKLPGVSKSEGMSGIGADQGALFREAEDSPGNAQNPSDPEIEKTIEKGPAQINSIGGPGYGKSSIDQPHSSSLLNKLDPRVGLNDEQREDSLKKYESKYGTVQSEGQWSGEHGKDMAGIGPDNRSLLDRGQNEQL